MRYRRPYVLFKKKLKSGTKIWYYYIYDAQNRRRQFSTGSKTRAGAEIYCAELFKSSVLSASQTARTAFLQTGNPMFSPVQNFLIPPTNPAQQGIQSLPNPYPTQTAQAKTEKHSSLFQDYVKDWFVFDKCEYIQRKLLLGFNVTRGYADRCRATLVKHILPFFGKYRLNEITAEVANSWVFTMKKNGKLQNSTINCIIKVLKVILAEAFRKGDIKENVAKKMAFLKSDSRTHGILTKEEADRLLDPRTVETVWKGSRLHYALNLVASKTGMRIGEVSALKKESLFPDHILVAHSWSDRYGLKDTKNHKSREVPISPELQSVLSEIAEGQTEGDFIFSSQGGRRPVYRKSISAYFEDALERIGIGRDEQKKRYITFHSWRHYVNTLLIKSGVPKTIVQSIIGHVNDDAMTEHYTHIQLEDTKQVLGIV